MFVFRGQERHSRSLLKAISWRTLGSLDTFMLGWLFTSNVKAAGAIASTEVFTKILLYYFHERAWSNIGWGVRRDDDPDPTPGAATDKIIDKITDRDSEA